VPPPGKRLPDLPDTGRRYLGDTMRARLASPGIERFERRRGGGGRVLAAVALVVALLVAMVFLSQP
jgi:hypothetical protein